MSAAQPSDTPRALTQQLLQQMPPTSAPLPDRDSLIEVANGLRRLLFPGVWLTPGSTPTADDVHTCFEITRLHLETLIGTAIRHQQATELRIHQEQNKTEEDPADELAVRFLQNLPRLQVLLKSDVSAAFDGDPAAKTEDEIIVCYPGIQAVLVYRMAHALLQLGVPYVPRMLSEWAHGETGIDIHPGAKIGPRFFIDHGTGVVVGETCVIGSGVTLYQGVTLGAWSFPRDEDGRLIRGTKRHPTLEDDVKVYSNATVLGGTTVVGKGSLIGSSVTLSRSIPPNTVVTIEKPSLQFRDAG